MDPYGQSQCSGLPLKRLSGPSNCRILLDGQTGKLEVVHNGQVIASESWQTVRSSERTKLNYAHCSNHWSAEVHPACGCKRTIRYGQQPTILLHGRARSRRVIACIGAAAHPDLGAIRIRSNHSVYDIQTFDIASLRNPAALSEALNEADVVIAHNYMGNVGAVCHGLNSLP